MQDQIKKHTVSVEQRGVRLSMRGDFEVTSLELNDELDGRTQSGIIMALMREAREQLQKEMAKAFAGQM